MKTIVSLKYLVDDCRLKKKKKRKKKKSVRVKFKKAVYTKLCLKFWFELPKVTSEAAVRRCPSK